MMGQRHPWNRRTGFMADCGPGQEITYKLDGHLVQVKPLELTALSGRRRYQVHCLSCMEELHEATTGPQHYLDQHVGYPRWRKA